MYYSLISFPQRLRWRVSSHVVLLRQDLLLATYTWAMPQSCASRNLAHLFPQFVGPWNSILDRLAIWRHCSLAWNLSWLFLLWRRCYFCLIVCDTLRVWAAWANAILCYQVYC